MKVKNGFCSIANGEFHIVNEFMQHLCCHFVSTLYYHQLLWQYDNAPLTNKIYCVPHANACINVRSLFCVYLEMSREKRNLCHSYHEREATEDILKYNSTLINLICEHY